MAAVLKARERRRAIRVAAAGFGLVDAAIVRPGQPVIIRAVSVIGALVASSAPLRPGARADLALENAAGRRWTVATLVVRCWVAALNPLCYWAALEFDAATPEGMGSAYPSRRGISPGS